MNLLLLLAENFLGISVWGCGVSIFSFMDSAWSVIQKLVPNLVMENSSNDFQAMSENLKARQEHRNHD